MKVNKATKLFFSVSSNPGNFGATLYNTAFNAYDVNAIYKPLKASNVAEFTNIFEFCIDNADGLSVSMPFKREAFARCGPDGGLEIKNVNTVVFDRLLGPVGFNTDASGFEESALDLLRNSKTAVIYGDGAVAESIRHVLKKYNISHLTIDSRKNSFPSSSADLFINATPIGMNGVRDCVFTEEVIKDNKYIFDVVVKKETNLIKLAKNANKPYVNGVSMSLEQLIHQFQIYTNIKPDRQLFVKQLKKRGYM